jgi:hypothetical protein
LFSTSIKDFPVLALYWHYINRKTITTMKSSTKTTVLLKALDMQLKALIQADLENFKSARSGQKQSQVQQAA